MTAAIGYRWWLRDDRIGKLVSYAALWQKFKGFIIQKQWSKSIWTSTSHMILS